METPRETPALAPAAVGERPGLARPLVLLIGAACVVLTGSGIRAASEIVAPTMLALVLTIAVHPLAGWARRHGWPNWCGIVLTLVTSCAMVLVLVLGVTLAVTTLVDLIPQYADGASEVQANATAFLTGLGVSPEPAGTVTNQVDPARLTELLTGFLRGVAGAVGNIFFLGTLLFFFCTAVPLLGARAATLEMARPELARSLARFGDGTQRYLVVSALFGAIVAVLDAGALWLLGIPLPLVWGLLSFITNFIPNIGFVIGVIPPALLALLDGGWGAALVVIAVYSGLNIVIQTFIQPRYVGASVGLSVEMTFLSLMVWTFLLGPLGALLAIPMTLLVRAVLIEPDARMAWIMPLISTSARTPDD